MRNNILSQQNICFSKRKIFWILFAFVFHSLAIAESLPDPTRPYNAAKPAITKAGPVLQSVLISPSHQVAIINGERVAVGDQYDGTQLVSLSDGEAVLKGKNGLQTLTLFPGNEKYGIKWNKQPSNDAAVSNPQIAQGK